MSIGAPALRGPRELAYAEITSNFVNPNANENDIAGLVDVPVVAGVRPFFVEFHAGINNATANHGWTVKLYRKTGEGAYAAVFDSILDAALNANITGWRNYRARQTGLVVGQTYLYKATLDTQTSGTLTILASATRPCFLRAQEV